MGELTGHSKRVTDAKFLGHQDLMVTTSADKTSRLWAVDGDAYKCKVSCPHCLKLCFRKSPERAPFSFACSCLAACCVTLMLSCLSGVENGHQLQHTWLILPLAADSEVSSCHCIQTRPPDQCLVWVFGLAVDRLVMCFTSSCRTLQRSLVSNLTLLRCL